ncbi:MAG: hypothetical protein QW561_03385 [Candidatus Aenigmatarchaeota archaeon]
MSEVKRGIITYIEKVNNGLYVRLNARIWAFIPKNIDTSIIQYGNSIELEGQTKYTGRRDLLIVRSMRQLKPCDLSKSIRKIQSQMSPNSNFLAYLWLFKRSLYKKFTGWSESRQSEYALNPYKLYLRGYLDYHTAKALADVTAVLDTKKLLPALVKHLSEEAIDEGEPLTVEKLFEKIKQKYDVTEQDVINASKQAGVVIKGNTVIPGQVFYAKESAMKELQHQKSYPLIERLKGIIPSDMEHVFTYRYSCLSIDQELVKTLIPKLRDIPGILVSSATARTALELGVDTVQRLLNHGHKDCKLLILCDAHFLNWWVLKKVLYQFPRVVFVGDVKQPGIPDTEPVFSYLVKVLPCYTVEHNSQVSIVDKGPANIESIVELYLDLLKKSRSVQIITTMRVGPFGSYAINRRIIRKLGYNSELYDGCKVIVTQNTYRDGKLLLARNQLGTVEIKNGSYIFHPEGSDLAITCSSSALEPAHAVTVYQCQHKKWQHVIAVMPEKELKHVMERAVECVYVFRC